MIRILLAMLILAGSGQALALPEALRKGTAGWVEWGSGEMTWLGFRLYRATLWVATEPSVRLAGYLPPSLPANAPAALQLAYLRDIPRDRLVETSVDELRRLGATETQLQRWEPELRRVFPDVKEGDEIVGVHWPGRSAAFYYRGRPTGEVADAEFAKLFFAIWLDPRSRSPSLRAALLKRPPP